MWWLAVFVCAAISGTNPCKTLTPADQPFPAWQDCQSAGRTFASAWLARHKGWEEGGIGCSVERFKP
jgi:hypothetical protein